MKSILGRINLKGNSKVSSFEILTENEMLKVRGGVEPIKPTSRPKDVYGEETM